MCAAEGSRQGSRTHRVGSRETHSSHGGHAHVDGSRLANELYGYIDERLNSRLSGLGESASQAGTLESSDDEGQSARAANPGLCFDWRVGPGLPLCWS